MGRNNWGWSGGGGSSSSSSYSGSYGGHGSGGGGGGGGGGGSSRGISSPTPSSAPSYAGVRNGVSIQGAQMMGGLYMHYQFGRNKDYYIDASTLDFSGVTQEQLGLTQTPNKPQLVDLFKTGINELSLSFGTVTMTYQGNDQFTINDEFNFDYHEGGITARNAATLIGGLAVFGRIFDYKIPVFPLILQPNYHFGGPFLVKFNGTVTIR
jgi:hypothetical protein